MKTILKKIKHYVCTCESCGTIFSYEREDLDYPMYPTMVKCPTCENRNFHWKSEVVYDES